MSINTHVLLNHLQQFTDHPELLSLIKGCLAFKPGERLTAKECLKHPYFHSIIESKEYQGFIPPEMRKTLKRQKQGELEMIMILFVVFVC